MSGRERKKKEQKRIRQVMQVYGGDKVVKRIKKADKESIKKLCYLNNDFCRVEAPRTSTIGMSDNNSNSHSEALNGHQIHQEAIEALVNLKLLQSNVSGSCCIFGL